MLWICSLAALALLACSPSSDLSVDSGADGTAGVTDAGTSTRGGTDAGMDDAGHLDAGTTRPDAGSMDAGTSDAGEPDAGFSDAGHADAGVADAGAPSGSFSGAITQFPLTIAAPSVNAGALPLLSLYWSDDQGQSLYSDYEWCARAYGSSTMTPAFVMGSGELDLLQSYCTAQANQYDAELRPASDNHQGTIETWPFSVSDSAFSAATLPAISVYWSNDGAGWYSIYEACAEVYGRSATSHTFEVSAGQLTFPQNWCVQSASQYQVVTSPGTKTFKGSITGWPTIISDPIFDLAHPPQVSVYWSDNDGATWYSSYATCAITFGSAPVAHTFSIQEGSLALNQQWCTQNATSYQVVVVK